MLAFILQFLVAIIISTAAIYLYRLGKKLLGFQTGTEHKELRSPKGGIKAPWGWLGLFKQNIQIAADFNEDFIEDGADRNSRQATFSVSSING